MTPIPGGNWVKYAVALSAPGSTGFPVPYMFTVAAAAPFKQATGAFDWAAGLNKAGKVRGLLKRSLPPSQPL